MSSKGQVETEILKQNLEEQLQRLIQQLSDLKDCREDFDPDEYEEARADTIEQLTHLNRTLKKHLAGNVTLVDELSAIQLATQAAISNAFQTADVIRMFARWGPVELRERLQVIERDLKLGKLPTKPANKEKSDILLTLRHLGEKLSPAELLFISDQTDGQTAMGENFKFEQVTEDASLGERETMALASGDISASQKSS